MGALDVAGLSVGLARVGAFGDGDVVVREQSSFGFFQGNDRDIVSRLVLGLSRHGGSVLADGVEESVDGDPAFLVIGPLRFEPESGCGPQPRGCLELLVVGVDFQEESSE